MNFEAIKSIYFFEMARMRRTLLQSVVSPVITTSLHFIVFGNAIGSRIQEVGGVPYGVFITPGLIMLSLLTQCIRYCRSEERRGGKECVSTCRFRWSRYHLQTKKEHRIVQANDITYPLMIVTYN